MYFVEREFGNSRATIVSRKSFNVDDNVPPPTISRGSGLKDVKVFIREPGSVATDAAIEAGAFELDEIIVEVEQEARRTRLKLTSAPATIRLNDQSITFSKSAA